VEFRILGSVSVADEGAEIAIPGAKLRALLALLLIRRGETVRADRLADDLWGDAIPTGFQNALQSLISKLRRSLGDSGRLLVTDNDGYRLDVAAADIDAHQFEIAARAGRDALADGRHAEASSDLARALLLWRGPALQGLADDGLLQREAVRLEEMRLGALEDRIDADMQLGRHAELIPELTAVTAEHPLRERFHGFLMLALYRSGRQADGLRAFQDARTVLSEELGLDPGPELRALEQAILNHDASLDLDLPRSATVGTARRRTNLVAGLSSFIGRRADVVALSQLVDEHRLVTIVGPGGAGKTRLSVEMASGRDDADDAWIVELAPLTTPLLVAETIATALGATDSLALNGQPPMTALERVIEHCSERDTVIVLDNCEHVIAEAARITESLLVACPLLRIVATSREALSVPGELVWTVPSMTTEDAVALFAERAGAASGFVLTPETEPIVRDLCARLDGLPLAIELAAGRSRAFPVRQLAARLDDRFRLLTGGSRTALPRQQTLRAVVEWSYDLLFEHEQKVFDRLSVFAGGCSLDAAEAVCADDEIDVNDIADILGHLVDKSLVIADHSGGEVRFRLLQTLALFGRDRLASSPDAQATRARHAAHFGQLCVRGHAAFRGDRQEAWLTAVERDVENLHVAMAWTVDQGDALTSQTNLAGLGWSWWFAGRGDDGWRWLTAALECPGPTTAEARAGAALWACYVGFCAGVEPDAAWAYGLEALTLARESGDDDLLALVLSLLGDVSHGRGDAATAVDLLDEAARLASTRGDVWSRGVAANAAGRSAEVRGDLEPAERLQRESLVHFDALGVDWATAIVGGSVAMLAERRGDVDEAISIGQRSRHAAARLRLGGYEAMQLARLGDYFLWKGDAARAEELNEQALALAEEVRYTSASAVALASRAIARRHAGRLEEAEEDGMVALDLLRASGMNAYVAKTMTTLGLVAALRGDHDRARAMHSEALAAARSFDDARGIALALEGLADLALRDGAGDLAATLLGSAAEHRGAGGAGSSGAASDAERITREAIDLIGEAAFAEAFARGVSSPLEAFATT